jgi:diguanylate cyclase (GGDEF)-like protein
MTNPMIESEDFAGAVIDALALNICVIDKSARIVAVNRAWQDFATENPPVSDRTGVGAQYLDVCRQASGPGSEGAANFATGLQAVLDGQRDMFEMEYPCHSPTENRWFVAHVSPLQDRRQGAVISHLDITDRKLLQIELTRLAETDPLTGLPNRRFFVEAAAVELERVARFGTSAALVMIDLDRFKQINDMYGHAAGDAALRGFAQSCKSRLRHVDVFARIGGDEFVVLLPGTDGTAALGVAEKLHQELGALRVASGGTEFQLAASLGVAEIRPHDRDIDESLARADAALYAAKQAGRNRAMDFADLARGSGKTRQTTRRAR